MARAAQKSDSTMLLGAGAAVVLLIVGAAMVASGGSDAWSAQSSTVRSRMTAAQVRFMNRLRALVPEHIPLVVSSSRRTPEDQAEALRAKIRAGADLDELRELYGYSKAIEEIVRYPMSAWGGVIQAQVDRGLYLSRHLRDDGLDLSVKFQKADGSWGYMPTSWQQQIASAALKAGAGRAFVEDEPLHVHIEQIAA